jgi:hypothetical protein
MSGERVDTDNVDCLRVRRDRAATRNEEGELIDCR